MKTIVIHDGPLDHALVLTSLITGLHRAFGEHDIVWVTGCPASVFYAHQKAVQVVPIDQFTGWPHSVDRCFSLGSSAQALNASAMVKADHYYGMYTAGNLPDGVECENADDASQCYESIHRNRLTKQSLFQLFFRMANLSWRGEGYNFRYFPRAKEKKNMAGVAIENPDVRQYVKTHLVVTEDKLWHIPIKQDPLKQFDEVNRCDNVITDNPFVFHVAMSLRKHVELLVYEPPMMRVEFFGKGHCHLVPEEVVKGSTMQKGNL